MDASTLKTRIQLRLQDAHREESGDDDLKIGHRIGLLHAMNIVSQVANDLETEDRLGEEVAK